jgi:hypothetical protein
MQYVAIKYFTKTNNIESVVGPFPTQDQAMTYCESMNKGNAFSKHCHWDYHECLTPWLMPALTQDTLGGA